MENSKIKKALIMIEFQNDWLAQDSVLNPFMQDREQFEDSVINAKKLLSFARKNDWHIIHAGYAFSKNYAELGGRQTGMWGLIKQTNTFQKGTSGAEYHDGFAPIEGEFEISGRTGVSVFSGSNLDHYLKNNDINELYLAGYALHACVESSFRDAHDRGYTPIVVADATSTFTKEMKEHFLQNIVYAFGQNVSTNELVIGH